jgi:hypothetical protein
MIDNIEKIIPTLASCFFKYQTTNMFSEGILSYRYEKATNGRHSILMMEELAPGYLQWISGTKPLFANCR